MGKWVSIYFNEAELEKLEKIRRKIEVLKGRHVSFYELLKEWVLDRLLEECKRDNCGCN